MSFAVSTADGDEPTADPDQVSILLTLPSGSQTVQTYTCDAEEPPEPVNCNDLSFHRHLPDVEQSRGKCDVVNVSVNDVNANN